MRNKYFYDCEFLEGTQTKTFLGIPYSDTRKTIDLISIGVVAQNGRVYYAVSKDFNLKEAWNRYDLKTAEHNMLMYSNGDKILYNVWGEDVETEHKYKVEKLNLKLEDRVKEGEQYKVYWIRENVLKNLHREMCGWVSIFAKTYFYNLFKSFTLESMENLIRWYGKTNNQIANELLEFFDGDPAELFGYYSAYDHVCLSWLYGKMIDLPENFPMHTTDLKQTLDQKVDKVNTRVQFSEGPTAVMQDMTIDQKLYFIKKWDPLYPQEMYEHSALSDAKFNKDLYNYLSCMDERYGIK